MLSFSRDSTGFSALSRSRSAYVAEKLTSRPAFSNRRSSMPTITGRSNTGLLGAILTTGRAMVFLGTWWSAIRILSLGVVRCASRRSQVLLLDSVGVEFRRAVAHGLQDFLERRRIALDPAQRVDAADHECAQVGADEAALLEFGHDR